MLRLACLALLVAPVALPAAWLDDLDAAKKLAQKTGRPIFVVFRCEH